jgi:NADH-quinone oxidoreductase subunit N
MAGFAGKYYLFYAALVGGHPELLIIGVLASILGIYYYLRVTATMFMEQESEATPAVPATPVFSTTGSTRRVRPGATGGLSTGGAATAVAVKRPSTQLRQPSTSLQHPVEQEPAARGLIWFSWLGLGIATLGTLAMGTILPFWLVNLAVHAAGTMLK